MQGTYELLEALAEWTAMLANFIAVLVVLAGTLIAVVGGLRYLFSPAFAAQVSPRALWVRYARWLVAALTFQLAADIVETTVAPSFEEIGKLAAIAVIRTMLNYFLERDINEARSPDQVGVPALKRRMEPTE